MKKYVCLLAFGAVLLFAVGACDDVQKTTKVQTTHESEPEMVSPGEEVIE